jgi:ABC-2 type transport system ATP-binding protein
LDFAGLTDRGSDRVVKYSGGMKRRLNLACALVHEPRLLVLDEPTVGVDPQSRNHIFDSIEGLKKQGLTVLYTTHYMEEAQRLCNRVAIMDHGKLLALDSVENLLRAHSSGSVVIGQTLKPVVGDPPVPGEWEGAGFRIETTNPLETLAALQRSGVETTSLHIERPNLESVFLRLTGRSRRD